MTNSQGISREIEFIGFTVGMGVLALFVVLVIHTSSEVMSLRQVVDQQTAQLDRLTTQRSTHFKTDIGRIQQAKE